LATRARDPKKKPGSTTAAVYATRDSDALIVVDVQNDFCPDGALAVPRGDEVVPIVNRLAENFRNVILTQDWHPPGHLSFASAHPGRSPYDTIPTSYGPQVLWPDHCVQGTPGAAFHSDLRIPMLGWCCARDSIAASIHIRSSMKTTAPTGLTGYLRERGITRLFLAGLALDFCVRYSAEDAVREGFVVVVIEDACRGIDVQGSVAAARSSLAALKATRITAGELSAFLDMEN